MDCECRLFGKNETFIMKAVGVSLMLVHHLFFDMAHLEGCSFWILRGGGSLVLFAQMCKVCVAIFVFLSGYGMYVGSSKAYDRQEKNFLGLMKYSIDHIRKLLVSYWWAVIPFAVIGISTGMRSFQSVYGDGFSSCIAAITDFFGINFIRFGHAKMYNGTCWYLAVALALYILFPVLKSLIDKSSVLAVGVSLLIGILPQSVDFLREPVWILSFAFGMLCAKYQVLDHIMNQIAAGNRHTVIGSFVLFAGTALFRYQHPILTDCFFAFGIICVVLVFVKVLPTQMVNGLIFVGKHSANIFMTHTFFFSYFWKDFIYAPRYPVLIFTLLLAVCIGYSVVLEAVKQRVLYCS